MIITDLDQTLLRDDGSVSDYTRSIWRECKRRGIVTGIATARLEANAVQIQEDLGADLLSSLAFSRKPVTVWPSRSRTPNRPPGWMPVSVTILPEDLC